MENNLEDDALKKEEAQTGGASVVERLLGGVKKILNVLAWPISAVWAPKNRARFVIFVMVGSVVVAGLWVFQDERAKKASTPLGGKNFNAMMAMARPPEGRPFFVYVSENRDVAGSAPSYFSLFPSIPVDSVAVALYPDEGGPVLFASAAYCMDWNSLDNETQKKAISVQRGKLDDLSFIFGSSAMVDRSESVDEVPVFSVAFPGHDAILFSIYGNVLLVSDDREDMIGAIRALIHPMTRLSWNEGTSRIVRTYVEDDRRYRFFLYPEGKDGGQELPRRINQALSPSLLLNIAIRKADPEGLSEEALLWLTRKGDHTSNDTSFASDNLSFNIWNYLSFLPSKGR
nr:hypothetical protein [uncultured Dethiosulfovibrio sp.]